MTSSRFIKRRTADRKPLACWLISVLPFLAGVMLVHGSPAFSKTIGTFRPAPALSLYLVKEQPGPITLRVGLLRGPSQALGDHVSVRVFNPDEDLIFRRHFNLAEPREEFILGSMEEEGLNYDMHFGADPEDPKPWAQIRVDLDEPGIYQVRVAAGSHNTFVTLDAAEVLDYGVSFQNGRFNHWTGQPDNLWAFVPPRAKALTVSGQGVSIENEAQAHLLDFPQGRSNETQQLDVDQTETLWRFQMHPQGAFRAWGFPLILCNTPEAARRIRASIVELPDGTIVAHRFQKEIYERLRTDLLDPSKIGELQSVIPAFTEAHQRAMEADAIAASALVNSSHNLFNYARLLLESQNTDPTSHFAGSLIGWQEVAERPAPGNRWDEYDPVPPLRYGISDKRGRWASTVAWLCTDVNRPWNPYYGNTAVIQRLAAGALADLLKLTEDERFAELRTNDYPGSAAFVPSWRTVATYAAFAPHVDTETRELWTRSLAHFIDRAYPDTIVSARNQSSHYLKMFQDFAQASQDPAYAELERGYVRRFIQSQDPAGWFSEATGPDATYNGMTHWYLAAYALDALESNREQAKAVLESLARSYRFFNHTVAPEPDGTVRGGFNFSHRTASGFYGEQYGGARGQVAHLVPEVAVWRQTPVDPEERLREAREHVRHGLVKPQDEIAEVIYMEFMQKRFDDINNTPLQGITWPALEEASFIRNFDDELVAVRRPSYFASIYVGKPAGAWYIRHKEDLREPYPDDQDSRGGKIGGLNHPQYTLLGGGLSLLHSPGYGNAVLATNWSLLTHHGPVLIREDGTRAWADYHATEFQLDEAADRLAIQGALDGAAISFERTYTFADDALHQQVRFEAQEPLNAQAFFENIPLALGSIKARGATLTTAEGAAPPLGEIFSAQTLRLRDEQGHGFDLQFATPQKFIYQPNGLTETRSDGSLTVGRLQVMLAIPQPGTPTEVAYQLTPVQTVP